MTKHSSQTKSRELPFFDLIDKKISFDFLLGIFVCAFKREKWNENIKVKIKFNERCKALVKF